MKKIVLAASTVFLCFQTWAQNSTAVRIHNNYQSIRAMGMGNAFTAIADDYSGMFYNPSLLPYRKDSEFQFNIVSAGLATETLKLVKDVEDAGNVPDVGNARETAISNVLEKYYGKPLGARITPLEFTWVSPNWGLSLMVADLSLDLMIQRQLGPAIDIALIKDTTLNYSYGWFLSEEMTLGVLGKFTHRNEFIGQYAAVDLALDSKIVDMKKTREGTNFDVDIGFSWKPTFVTVQRKVAQTEEKTTEVVPPPEVSPSPAPAVADTAEKKAEEKIDIDKIDTKTDGVQINTKKSEDSDEIIIKEQPLTMSAVVRNVIGVGFTKTTMVNKDAFDVPANNPRVLDVGISYNIFDAAYSKLKVSVEGKNMGHPQTTIRKSSHLGLEYSLGGDWAKLQLRAGMNQMYYTAGVGVLLTWLDLQFATYGEEFGNDDAKAENRAYAMTLALKF